MRRPNALTILHRLALAALLGLAPGHALAQQPAPPPESVPYAFVVPVTVTNLHSDLTLVRVRCWVFPRDDWRSFGGALGEGVSQAFSTRLEGQVRGFTGEIDVAVPLRDPRVDAAAGRSYRCQIELYDQVQRAWGDMAQIDQRHPIDREALSVAETGGILGR